LSHFHVTLKNEGVRVSQTETDKAQTTSWRDKTLKAAGYGYLVGDIALAASGILKNEKNVFRAGTIWAAGGVGAAVWGNPDTEKQLEILAHKLESYLRHHGAIVTDETRKNAVLLRDHNGLGAKLDRFLHEHPTEILNAAYAVGASVLLHKGVGVLLKGSTGDALRTAVTRTGMGAFVLAGALGGLLIKEDPQAHEKADSNSITSKVVAYIKEKPMRFSSAMYWGGNAFTGYNAWLDFSNRNTHGSLLGIKPYHFSALTLAAYITSNGLLALSSRDQIEEKKFKPEHLAQLEQVAAEIIAAQPPQLQAQLLTGVAEYLAKERMVGASSEELSKQLIARVSETGKKHLAQASEHAWAEKVLATANSSPALA
jgi:hypothetical protein